jgi:2-dehydro-3-deoxygalactonokinase
MATQQQTAWIAVDWGTSAMRAWALGADGDILAHARSADGMSVLGSEEYEPALIRLAGAWLPEMPAEPIPVVICGMAGARQGWREAPYRTVPCAPVDSGAGMAVPTADRRLAVRIVPGLRQLDPPDVMRGEETQLAGLAAGLGTTSAIACMPGTHCKWVRLDKGLVTAFRTCMTGELFDVIATRTVLRHSIADEGADDTALMQAVGETLANPQRLAGALFGIRAADIVTGSDPRAARSRLSGLLIGAELAATRQLWESETVHLVGLNTVCRAYALGLESAGSNPVIEDVDKLTLAGLALAKDGGRIV